MDSRQTVTFNIGGKVYEVSKSLLHSFPGTVLARKASDAEESLPIFIDRDPDRFAYCLDFMRDNGRVHLTDKVSKESFLKDLQVLGFDNVNPSLIQYDTMSQQQTAARFHTNVGQFICEVDNMRHEIVSLQQKIKMGELALYCLSQVTESVHRGGKMEVHFGYKGAPFPEINAYNLPDKAYFKECCLRLGLQLESVCLNGLGQHFLELRLANSSS